MAFEMPPEEDFAKGCSPSAAKFARSSTGEIDGKARTFKAVTAKSEAFVLCDKGSISGSAVSIDNKDLFASFMAAAIDGKSLKESSRLLFLHLTDSTNTKIKFSDRKMSVLESYGSLPHRVRRGEADVKIPLVPGAAPKVYAIDLAGRRIGEVKASFSQDGTLSFTADTFAFKTPCLAYEIIR